MFIDQLTRAHNRKFLESIEGDTKFIKDNSPIGVVVVDIDFFKNINDSYGHKFGDYVLKTISFTIQQNIRSNDHLIRLGGEEFLIILTNSEHQKTIQITERLHNEIRAMSFKNSGVHTVNITVSMGVYTIKNTNENIIDAIDKGDIALYASKRNGRNMTSIYGV
ncbi:GGDEF domain-containing protein [Escherichia coli]|nr:GGDEF domain-containing protein [Escherichia coli]